MKPWILLAAGLLLAALALTRLHGDAAGPAGPAIAPDTRKSELARCRDAGEAAGADPTCRAAWRAARTRFLGGRP